MSKPDAYFYSDRLKEQCEAISDARADWLEHAAIRIAERFKAELKADGELVEHDLQEEDITIMAAEAGVSVDKFLFDLAYKQADESGLSEKLSWDQQHAY